MYHFLCGDYLHLLKFNWKKVNDVKNSFFKSLKFCRENLIYEFFLHGSGEAEEEDKLLKSILPNTIVLIKINKKSSENGFTPLEF